MFYLEGWIKAAAGTDGIARLHIMYYNAAGTYINQSIVVGTNSATYTKASVVGTAPANTAYLVVNAGVDNTSTTGTWYFDDLYFAKVSRNEPLQLGSTTTDASAAFLGLDSYNQASDPSGGFNGAMYYNTSTNKFRCYENGMWNNCLTGALYSTTADATTVDGNTAMVQKSEYNLHYASKLLYDRSCYQLYASGVATSTTTAQPIQFVIRFGTTNLTALSNNYTPANSQTNVGWTLDASLTCRAAPSAASAVLAQGTVVGQTSTTATVAGTAHALAPANTAGVNVATNAAQTVTVGVQFSGTANAANTLTLKQMYVNPL